MTNALFKAMTEVDSKSLKSKKWIDRMNAAIEYIEDNLTGDIDISVAASRAYCSEYHFTFIFSFIGGLSPSEYVRNRRLTMAGFILQRSNVKVIDVAYMYGYNSPNSFTRAFVAFHGILPSKARDIDVKLKSFPRLTFTTWPLEIKELAYRIEEEGEGFYFGKSFITKNFESYETVPRFIEKCEAECITKEIVEAGHGNEKTLLKGLMWNMDDGMMKYMLCLDISSKEVHKSSTFNEFEIVKVPAKTWAVFPMVIENPDEDSIISIWKRIWTEWFQYSGYELDDGPRQERCYWRDDGKMQVEAWVSVIKNK